MVKTALYGGGGFGQETKVLLDYVAQVSKDRCFSGFIDDYKETPPKADLTMIDDVLISIADPFIRMKIAKRLVSQFHFSFANLFHPDVFFHSSNQIGIGCIICSGVKVTTNASIGDFCILNLNSIVGHDVKIGPFCSIMPSANILGGVKIGEGVFIGAGATILQNVSIGNGAVIGAGSVVTRSVYSNEKVMGVPARSKS